MELFEAIIARHCFRGAFKPEPVPQDDLRKIVQAGLDAPSGRNSQTTQFVIVDDPEIVKAINGMSGANGAQKSAPAFILCITDVNPDCTSDEMTFKVEDVSAAVQNMLLALTALGYASVWIDGWLRIEGRADAVGHLLPVP